LVALGATLYPWRYRPGADFVVLQDPGGHFVWCPNRTESSWR
jgi:hypothetical protein